MMTSTLFNFNKHFPIFPHLLLHPLSFPLCSIMILLHLKLHLILLQLHNSLTQRVQLIIELLILHLPRVVHILQLRIPLVLLHYLLVK